MAFGTLEAFRQYMHLRREQWLDDGKLEALGRERLSKMLELSMKTKHYRDSLDRNSITAEDALEDITALPLTTKQDVIADPGSFIPESVGRRSLTSIKTSGSSGMPIEIFSDAYDHSCRTAASFMVDMEYGRGPRDIVAKVHDINFPVSALARLGIYRREHLSIFESEEKNLSLLRRSGANILSGYTSTLAVMAGLNREDPLRMKYSCCFGEILSEGTREMISDSFSCPVYDSYGSNEFGLVAFECPEVGKLHVFSSLFILEIVDSQGRPARSGQIAITSLKNTGMPLLRYCIGDKATEGRECSCGRGFPTIERIEGRTDDHLILPSGKRRSPFSLFCLYDIKGIRCYQIVQEKVDLIVFNYVENDDGFDDTSKRQVLGRIGRACMGEAVSVEFNQVEHIPKGRTGKRRSVISKL